MPAHSSVASAVRSGVPARSRAVSASSSASAYRAMAAAVSPRAAASSAAFTRSRAREMRGVKASGASATHARPPTSPGLCGWLA